MLGYPTDISDGKYLTVLKSNNIYIFNVLKDIIIENLNNNNNNNNNYNWWVINRQITKNRRCQKNLISTQH
jgi:hypothetical protein